LLKIRKCVVSACHTARSKSTINAATAFCRGKRTRGPGSKWARERKGQGAIRPGSESSRERIDQGSIGQFAPGSEKAVNPPTPITTPSPQPTLIIRSVKIHGTHQLIWLRSVKICLFLSLFAHKRPSPFFYTYRTKNPLFKPINDQFIVIGIW